MAAAEPGTVPGTSDGRPERRIDRIAARRSGGRAAGRLYSRFVLLAKIASGVAAIVTVVAIASWPALQRDADGPAQRPASSVLVQAVHAGVDGRGRPYTISARRAWRPADEPDVVDMLAPDAEITTADGNWISLTAERGRYNETTRKLVLLGGVRVNQDEGLEFVTDEVHYLMDESMGWGDRPVAAQGAFGEIRSDGFRLFDGGATVVFTGRPRALLSSGSASGGVRLP